MTECGAWRITLNRANKRYCVRLEALQRAGLPQMVSVGTGAAQKRMHARVLLQAD